MALVNVNLLGPQRSPQPLSEFTDNKPFVGLCNRPIGFLTALRSSIYAL